MFDVQSFQRDTEKVLSVVMNDLTSVKTGRAKPSLVENVAVEAYGTHMKMMEVATISAPDTNMLVITPWDKSLLSAIEKAINAAELNINPVIDGDQIRISIPTLTQERREELVRVVKQKIESGKSMVRDVRQKHKKIIEDQEGKPGVSEDAIKRDLEELQRKTDEAVRRLEDTGKAKEQELMTV